MKCTQIVYKNIRRRVLIHCVTNILTHPYIVTEQFGLQPVDYMQCRSVNLKFLNTFELFKFAHSRVVGGCSIRTSKRTLPVRTGENSMRI